MDNCETLQATNRRDLTRIEKKRAKDIEKQTKYLAKQEQKQKKLEEKEAKKNKQDQEKIVRKVKFFAFKARPIVALIVLTAQRLKNIGIFMSTYLLWLPSS